MQKPQNIALFIVIIVLSISLIPIGNWVNGKVLFENLSEPINKQIVYQSVTLFVTIIFLLLLLVIKKDKFKEFFRKGNISAEILPERMVAINPKPNENWFNFGRNFAIIISVVTAVIIYFQVISQTEISFVRMLSVLPFSILFALSNSFVEESITRLGVVVVLKDIINDKIIPIVLSTSVRVDSFLGTSRRNCWCIVFRIFRMAFGKINYRNQRNILGLVNPFSSGCYHFHSTINYNIKLKYSCFLQI